MKFRTEIEVPELSNKLDYSSKALFIGSCFTANMGEYLQQYKFRVNINPFGVLYNPGSIFSGLNMLLNDKQFTADDLHYQNGLWFSYSHHSSFSSPDKDECLQKINSSIKLSSEFLKQTGFLFITLGTAWSYSLKVNKHEVANCHKTPAKEFERFLIEVDEIIERFRYFFNALKKINPSVKVIFSVSPIRHLKDGAHENQISKSTLLLGINKIQEDFDDCFYFPAYELLLDDLRDYRFYADDMCHPSKQAVEYIWNKFRDAVIEKSCTPVMKEIDAIVAAANHRPFNAHTPQHKYFQQKTIGKINKLKAEYPFMDFTRELKILS